jgi:hypothetical protein
MTVPHYDVVIATPGHSMHKEYVKSLMATTAYLTATGRTYHFVSQYSSFVPSARENTATDSYGADWEAKEFGAGKFTYDRIVWIDSDISWTVDNLEVLLSTDLDIVAGMMPISRDGRFGAMRFNSKGNPVSLMALDFLLEGEPFEVDGVSFGFLAVKQGVFEKMSRPWFKIRQTGIETVGYQVDLGEDYSWCVGATKAGFRIWVHPLVRVEHMKEMVLTV